MKTITSQQDGSPNQAIETPFCELDKKVIDIKDDFRRGVKRPCRVTTRVWKYMLLCNQDIINIDGNVTSLVAKKLGVGVFELSVRK